jgi:hypothetical protein
MQIWFLAILSPILAGYLAHNPFLRKNGQRLTFPFTIKWQHLPHFKHLSGFSIRNRGADLW